MATNYPGSLDTSTQQPSPSASTEMDDSGFEHDAVHTNHSGAIIALETKVGTGSSTAVANSVLAGTGSGTSGWTTTPTVAGLTVNGNIDGQQDFTVGNGEGEFVLFQGSSNQVFVQSNGTYRAYWNSSGHYLPYADSSYDLGGSSIRWRNAYFDGLDVAGDTTSTGHFTAQSGGADGGIVLGQAFSSSYVGLRTANMSESSGNEYNLLTDGNHTFISAGTTGDVYIRGGGNDSSCQILLDTSENEILMTGNVGIGGVTPPSGSHLQVASQNRAVSVLDSGTSNYAELGFTSANGDGPAYGWFSGYDIQFKTGTSRAGLATAMHIDNNSYVGIGETNPHQHLHVNSGNTNTTSVFESTDGTAYIGIRDSASSGDIYVAVGAVGNELRLRAGNSNHLHLEAAGTLENVTSNFYASASGATFVAANPTTGTGNDAEWAAPFGVYVLQRNSSLTAEKENITADLGTHLTASMVDSVVPKLWNRLHAPGYPEIGPLAEDMDAISPFLAAHGTDADGEQILTGINKTAYLSLLVLAVKDLRTRVADLEAA